MVLKLPVQSPNRSKWDYSHSEAVVPEDSGVNVSEILTHPHTSKKKSYLWKIQN